MTRRRSITPAGVLLFLLLRGFSAAADSRIYVVLRPGFPTVGPSTLVELSLTAAGPGVVRRLTPLPGNVFAGPVASSDGRFVAALIDSPSPAATRLFVLDARTGETTVFDGIAASGGSLLADPSALRFFVVDSVGLTILEPSGVRSLPIPGIRLGAVLSADGRELFVPRASGPGPSDPATHIAVLDPLTGADRRSLDVLPGTMAVTRDGRELYVARAEPSGGSTLRVFDAQTGAELRRREGLATGIFQSIGGIVLDEEYGRVFLQHNGLLLAAGGLGGVYGSLIALDSTSLATIGTGRGVARFMVDATQGLGVNVSTGYMSNFGWCDSIVVETWQRPNEPVAVLVPGLFGVCVRGAALATPPLAPENFSANVVGRRVELSWAAALGASDYDVLVGSESGSANLAVVRTGGLTSLVADNVPPGTYFVRVRAVNDVGASRPALETTVVVSP